MKDIVRKNHCENNFFIASAATSTEEIGNPVHRGTKAILQKLGISTDGKTAVQMTKADYTNYDYIIAMDDWNIHNIQCLTLGDAYGKIYKLLEFAGLDRDIADPWYSGDFDATYADVKLGCEALFKKLMDNNK